MLIASVSLLLLAACGGAVESIVPASGDGETRIHGGLHGGQQPVSGATVQLYAVGANGIGSASVPVFTTPVQSDSAGAFSFPSNYRCPSPSSEVYLTAVGGSPGGGIRTSNAALSLMTALGPCGSLTADTFINIDEVTTVAAVWALAPYMQSMTQVGADAAGAGTLSDAFASVKGFVSAASGLAPPGAEAAGIPVAKLYSLANILAVCVNSAGGSAGDGSICGRLFSLAPVAGSPGVSANVVDAALAIAQNPGRNVSSLFYLAPPISPFEPSLTAVPADWTLSVPGALPPPTITPATGSYTSGQIISLNESVAGTTIHYTLDGSSPSASSTLYTAPFVVDATTTVRAVAVRAQTVSAIASATLAVTPAAAKLVFVQQPTGTLAGAALSPAITVAIEDGNGLLVNTGTNAVTLSLGGPGAGALGGTVTANATGGVASFSNVTLSAAGQYTLQAKSGTLAAATSSPFLVSAAPIVTTGEQAVSALAFTDTVGINVHLNFGGTLYTSNFPLILSSLGDLGIRHVRDGLADFGAGPSAFYTAHQQLAAHGIHTDYISSLNQPQSLLKAWPSRVGDMESLEAPNEYDTSGDVNWAANLRAYLPTLQNAAHGTQPMAGVSVIGPSLVNPNWYATNNSYAQLGPVSSLFDFGNLHNYPGGRNPGTGGWTPQGYGSIAFALASARTQWPLSPMVTTETGYIDDPGMAGSVPDAVSARYMPRLLLEQYLHGITRTYIYELADDQFSGGSYGLMRADGTKKPAYAALQALMHLLSDPGSTYVAGRLPWTMTGGAGDVHHLLLGKRDGTLLLALWVEEPAYDVNTKQAQSVAAQSVSLTFASPVMVQAIHRWQADGSVQVMPGDGAKQSVLPLPVVDTLTVVQLAP